MTRHLQFLTVVAVTLAVFAGPAHAARHDAYPLRAGSSGPRVAMVKYLIRNPRPAQNVFRQVKGTYKPTSGMGGWWNPALSKAVKAYKWRLGFPKVWVRPVAGRYFIAVLRGQRTRPAKWVALAGSRLAAVQAATPTRLAVRWKLLLQSWLVIQESPNGSNRGPCISYSCTINDHRFAIQSATGAYGAAWCVSTQQEASLLLTGRTFADRTAGVFYAAGWAARRNLLHAKPKVGAIVTFMDGQGHMGYVVKVLASGFVSIEGNASNRVLERFHTFGDRRPAYIYLPGLA